MAATRAADATDRRTLRLRPGRDWAAGERPEALDPMLMTGSSGCDEVACGQPVLRIQKLRILCCSRAVHGAATRVRSDNVTLPGQCTGVQRGQLFAVLVRGAA